MSGRTRRVGYGNWPAATVFCCRLLRQLVPSCCGFFFSLPPSLLLSLLFCWACRVLLCPPFFSSGVDKAFLRSKPATRFICHGRAPCDRRVAHDRLVVGFPPAVPNHPYVSGGDNFPAADCARPRGAFTAPRSAGKSGRAAGHAPPPVRRRGAALSFRTPRKRQRFVLSSAPRRSQCNSACLVAAAVQTGRRSRSAAANALSSRGSISVPPRISADRRAPDRGGIAARRDAVAGVTTSPVRGTAASARRTACIQTRRPRIRPLRAGGSPPCFTSDANSSAGRPTRLPALSTTTPFLDSSPLALEYRLCVPMLFASL